MNWNRYIAAEQVPIQYGGLSKDGEFGTADSVTEITVKPSAKHIVEFPVTQVSYLCPILPSISNINSTTLVFVDRIILRNY